MNQSADPWVRHMKLPSGAAVLVRPLTADDDALIRDLLEHVSRHDLRLRFFGSIKTFSSTFIHRLTDLDRHSAMALIAFDPLVNLPIGVVRLHYSDLEQSEFAILLRSDAHGHGLGWTLMKLIIEFAVSIGLKRVGGKVLQENTVMIQMCRELGFAITTDRSDRGICNVSLELAAKPLAI